MPSELRAASMLARSLALTQVMSWLNPRRAQVGEKNVEEFATAVTTPCFEVVRVTDDPETVVTKPVKSSTKSSLPLARLLAAGGSVERLKTLLAARLTAETTCVEALMVRALAMSAWRRSAVA